MRGSCAGADDHKTPEDDDVEVSITHCGICGSDLHTISGGWYVCLAGHSHIPGVHLVCLLAFLATRLSAM